MQGCLLSAGDRYCLSLWRWTGGLLVGLSVAMASLAQPGPPGGGGSSGGSSETNDIKQRETGTPVDQQDEQIDTGNGNLGLRYRELHLPGPAGLDITVQRVYQLHATNAGLVYAYQGSYKWLQMGPGWTL